MKIAPSLLAPAIVSALLAARLLAQDAQPNLPPPELTEVWTPVPPIVTAEPGRPPSDAIVLFNGSSFDAWKSSKTGGPVPWKIEGDAMVVQSASGNIETKESFGDVQLHIEFRCPLPVSGKSQGRGNSGIFFMGLYELQVLDSYDNETYVNGQAGSLYKQHAPLVNASRKPGEWQTYDAVFVAPRFAADGSVLSPARVTVFHNGVLVQHDVALRGPTVFRGQPQYAAHAARLPLALQDHKNPTAFRNIWIRELHLP